MKKIIKPILLIGALLVCAISAGATVRYVEVRPTGVLQPNTTGPASVHVGSGTVKDLYADTTTVRANLNVARITETGSDIGNGQVLYSTGGILAGDAGMTYNAAGDALTVGAVNATTMTMTGTLTPNSIIDRNLTAGTTFDYLRSSGTSQAPIWSHAGLTIQSVVASVTASSSTALSVFPVTLNNSVTITPKFASSLIVIDAMVSNSRSNYDDACRIGMTRNGTNVLGGSNYFHTFQNATGTATITGLMPIVYQESPGVTTSLTYSLTGGNSGGGTTCTYNNNGTYYFRVQEIGQ